MYIIDPGCKMLVEALPDVIGLRIGMYVFIWYYYGRILYIILWTIT
jgi:uncharacterized membrane protein